ncbi:hypothetical protein M0R36_11335 [bacterium]|nr:hypothetical protein [bacterium]
MIFDNVLEIVKQEGDKHRFSYKGFDCLIIRHPEKGHLNGYVAITKLSPKLYKEIYYNDFVDRIDCHGGITYIGKGLKYWKIKKKKSVMWIGFDCYHYMDFAPYWVIRSEKILKRQCVDRKELESGESQYRNLDYVIEECKGIVNQILEG